MKKPRDQDVIRKKLAEHAHLQDRIDQMWQARNDLWFEAKAAGISSAEIAKVSGLSYEAVRLTLKKGHQAPVKKRSAVKK